MSRKHGKVIPLDMNPCGKHVYVTKEKAKRAAANQKDKGKLWPYRCVACGDVWHLTSQPTSQRTAWRDRVRVFGKDGA